MPFLFTCLTALSRAAAESPTPTPPAWQRDLDAVRVLQTTLALTPVADPAADADRHQRLGQLYGQLISRYPDQADVQKAAGDYYGQIGQTAAAVACLQRAETLNPQDSDVAENLGSAFLEGGQVREACDQFERAVNAQPQVAEYHFAFANTLFLFRREVLAPPGRPDEQAVLTEALAHFRLAAELAPTDRRLAQAYAETFYGIPHPDWTQALAAWKAVLLLSGKDTDFANSHLARVSMRLGRPEDMENYLMQIHSPHFDAIKAKFRQAATRMSVAATPTPASAVNAASQ